MRNDEFSSGFVGGLVFAAIVFAVLFTVTDCGKKTETDATKIAIQSGYVQMIDIPTGNPVWVRPAITNIYAPTN